MAPGEKAVESLLQGDIVKKQKEHQRQIQEMSRYMNDKLQQVSTAQSQQEERLRGFETSLDSLTYNVQLLNQYQIS